jgi:hypothetical protein
VSAASSSERIARKLYLAMKGLGTDENAINTELARVATQEEWEAVQTAFRVGEGSCSFQGGDLKAAIESELNQTDLITAKKHLWYSSATDDTGDARVWYSSMTVDTVARLYSAMKGLGTHEDEIYSALGWVKTNEQWAIVLQAYADTHPNFYGGSLKYAIYQELNTHDVNKAKARLERNGVHYDDKGSRMVRPGDVVNLLKPRNDLQAQGTTAVDNDVVYKSFHASCECLDIELTVWVDSRVIKGTLDLPLRLMVDATMHVAPRLLIIGASTKKGTPILEYDAAYPSQNADPKMFFKRIGDMIEETIDNFSFTMKCKKVEDYFQRCHTAAKPTRGAGVKPSTEIDPSIRSKRVIRAVVTWTYSVAGALVTLSTGDDRPYHSQLRLWLEGGHVLLVDRTDKGVVWTVMSPPNPSDEDAKAAFLTDIEEQCAAIEEGKEEPVARCIDYGSDGSRPVVMLDLRFPGKRDVAESVAEQASALADMVPCYKGCNPGAKPDESPDYADGNLRKPFAKPLTVQWAAPTMLHVLCGLNQIAAVTYGPPTYFESYHPRRMNCQAFVFDALFVMLMPPICESPLGAVIRWSDQDLDAAPAAALLRALKPHLVQDADKMLNAGGDCRLGVFSQKVAEWVMW